MKYPFRSLMPFLCFLLVISCDESTDSDSNEPSDLNLDVAFSEENPSRIEVHATAKNTTLYEFYSGEEPGVLTESNATGVFFHEYSETGIYQIELRAYGESGRYLKRNDKFLIDLESGSGPGNGDDGYETPLSYEGMSLVWQDEFNGNSLNMSDWTHEIGTGNNGWGNNELQYYRTENTNVADGKLTIEARQESFSGSNYTSSRIITSGNRSFQYGRIDIRAKLPEGQGIWPALWMLGDSFWQEGWPHCGEIDVMEMVGGDDRENTVHGTLHWQASAYASYGGSYTLPSGDFTDEFHVFSIVWDDSTIRWYVNDNQYHVIDLTPSHLDEFRAPFFFIFNVAVGGNWPGAPDGSTTFPQQMVVDYVRVFEQN